MSQSVDSKLPSSHYPTRYPRAERRRNMTLDKAIDQLARGMTKSRSTNNKLLREALGLGIEALKRIKEERQPYTDVTFTLLPGETERYNEKATG